MTAANGSLRSEEPHESLVAPEILFDFAGRIGGSRIVVKAAPTARFEIGEQVSAAIDLERVHLFDADNEAAIARR